MASRTLEIRGQLEVRWNLTADKRAVPGLLNALVAAVLAYGLRASQAAARAKAPKVPVPA